MIRLPIILLHSALCSSAVADFLPLRAAPSSRDDEREERPGSPEGQSVDHIGPMRFRIDQQNAYRCDIARRIRRRQRSEDVLHAARDSDIAWKGTWVYKDQPDHDQKDKSERNQPIPHG